MDDLIGRQEAIDTMCEACSDWCDEGVCKKVSALQKLPPAQPEIIQCRECKFASGDSRICMQFGHSPIGELDFCAWAERRTDEE